METVKIGVVKKVLLVVRLLWFFFVAGFAKLGTASPGSNLFVVELKQSQFTRAKD
jgi:hypothetical protein